MRPVLRPGAALLRRDSAHLQIGLEPGRAVVLADSERVRHVIAALDGVRDLDAVVEEVARRGTPDRAATRGILDGLHAAGVLADAAAIRAAAVPAVVAHRLARGERAGTAVARSSELAAAVVEVRGHGPLAASISGLLAASGVPVAAPGHIPGRVPARVPADAMAAIGGSRDVDRGPDAVVLVGDLAGSPDSDRLVASGTPHLVVAVVDGTGVLGPFVLPGRTGCLRCVDVARTALDPAWPALVAQLNTPARAPHGVPSPRSPVLEAALAAWSVREVIAHLVGGRTVTYGASVRFDDDLVEQVLHTWSLQPGCGCALLS